MTILITGIAGTLGKAFTRHLSPTHKVVGIDNSEWALAEFAQQFPTVPVMLKDFDQWRYDQTPVDVVIHCAAYKHVDLGEKNPHTFIHNNVEKTGLLFSECYKHNVDILFISTDKAVEPISTYGFTKALGERLAWYYNGTVARLGNILNSTGSVIPAWEQAIADKQPIRITDERMARYVIEDIDAVVQIWKGFEQGKGKNYEAFVPEMGPEQRLMDICMDVLNRHGYQKAEDYKPGFTIIGLRPGEKLHEKLKWSNEGYMGYPGDVPDIRESAIDDYSWVDEAIKEKK